MIRPATADDIAALAAIHAAAFVRQGHSRSFIAVMDLIARDLAMTAFDVRIAWLIVTRMNIDSEASWPGIDLLAGEAGVHGRSVRRSLERLGKYLAVERGGSGPKTPNRYSISPEIRRTLESERGTPESERGGLGSEKEAPRVSRIL